MTCQARILDTEEKVGDMFFYTTRECEKKSTKKIVIDDGEASLAICSDCMRRYTTRKTANTWYGWFDCDYPPNVKVKYSPLYYDTLKVAPEETKEADEEMEVAEAQEAQEAQEPIDMVIEQMETLTITPVTHKETPVVPTKESLQEAMASLKAQTKVGKKSISELRNLFNEIAAISLQLKMLPKSKKK